MKPSKTYEAIGAIGMVFLLLRFVFKLELAPLAGLTVIALALLIPWFALQLAKAWYALAEVLGKINSFLLMTVLFALVIIPIGYLRKLFAKKKKEANTTFIKVNQTYPAEYFNNPW